MQIILASASLYRQQLLQQTGLLFTTCPSDLDETQFHSQNLNPEELCQTLAMAKARRVAEQFPSGLIIASDQIMEIEGQVFGKPKTAEKAIEQLIRMQGQTHRILTSLAMIYPEKKPSSPSFASSPLFSSSFSHLEVAQLTMRPLTRAEIQAYVLFEQPYDCAGSYKLESAGITLMEQIKCQDYTSIIGLPLMALISQLRKWGLPFPFEKSEKQNSHKRKT